MSNQDSFVAQLAETIRNHRKLSGITQSQLAAFAGVGKTVIFDLEHAKATVRLDTLLKVLAVLNIQLVMIGPTGERHA